MDIDQEQGDSHTYDNAPAEIISLLTNPRILIVVRRFLKMIFAILGIVFAYLLLANIHSFEIESVRFLYNFASAAASLYALLNLYYSIIFFHHYRRIKHYIKGYWYKTLPRALVAQAAQILIALAGITIILLLDMVIILRLN